MEEDIEITDEYEIKILNLIFKKLFNNQSDYSTKQINDILNKKFSFYKREKIMNPNKESIIHLLSEKILEAYFFVENMFDRDIKEIYENIKHANNMIQNEEKRKYYQC